MPELVTSWLHFIDALYCFHVIVEPTELRSLCDQLPVVSGLEAH